MLSSSTTGQRVAARLKRFSCTCTAWLYLLHAEFLKAGIDYHYRDPKHPSRYQRVDGERKTWELDKCIKERWADVNDPVRRNLELTLRLRNRIEHRYEAGLMVVAAGFTQALIVNFEEELTTQFGVELTMADDVHLPVSLNTFSREGVARLIAAQQGLPKRLKDFFIDFRSGLEEAVVDDRRFEFRVDIVQKRAPTREADLAVSFVREEDLSSEERKAYEALERTGRVVLREKERPVANLGRYRPKAAASLIEAAIPFRFGASSEFPAAWRNLKIRPPANARGAARRKTDERYCIYDEPHDDYLYTQAFVDLLIRRCSNADGIREVVGRAPRPK
jgi:hypothetical protein